MRVYPGGNENRHIFSTVSRFSPRTRAASWRPNGGVDLHDKHPGPQNGQPIHWPDFNPPASAVRRRYIAWFVTALHSSSGTPAEFVASGPEAAMILSTIAVKLKRLATEEHLKGPTSRRAGSPDVVFVAIKVPYGPVMENPMERVFAALRAQAFLGSSRSQRFFQTNSLPSRSRSK